jgi:hypothetical protein
MAKKKQAEKARAAAEAARIQGENDSILYMKEHKAKAEVEKLQLDWKIKQHILDQPKTDKKEETAETAGKTDLESQVKALKSSEKVMTANIRNAENSIETTESQKLGVLQKISLAKASIEQLMNDPGKLADQDRQIGIAILGKLRVAKALINGDIVSLKHEQTKVPWVVRLREATEKALRHPSKENLEAAKEAYKQAAATNEKSTLDSLAAQEAEQKRLADEAKAAEEAKILNAKDAADKVAAAKEAARIQTAFNQAAADRAAAQAAPANSITTPTAAAIAPVEPVLPPPPIIRKVKRGFFDPIE